MRLNLMGPLWRDCAPTCLERRCSPPSHAPCPWCNQLPRLPPPPSTRCSLDRCLSPSRLGALLHKKREWLAERLQSIGFRVLPAQGTYFLVADFSSFLEPGSTEDDVQVSTARGKGGATGGTRVGRGAWREMHRVDASEMQDLPRTVPCLNRVPCGCRLRSSVTASRWTAGSRSSRSRHSTKTGGMGGKEAGPHARQTCIAGLACRRGPRGGAAMALCASIHDLMCDLVVGGVLAPGRRVCVACQPLKRAASQVLHAPNKASNPFCPEPEGLRRHARW